MTAKLPRRAALGALGLTAVSAVSAVAAPHVATAAPASAHTGGLDWQRLPDLPPNRVDFSPHVPVGEPYWRQLGLAGMAVGAHGDYLIAAGGTNFPEPALTSNRDTVLGKVYWDEAFVLHRSPTGYRWLPGTRRLPVALGYAAVVSTARGVLVIGGEGFRGGPRGAKQATVEKFADVFFLRYDPATDQVVTEALPSLPRGMSYGVAGVVGDTVYAAEGADCYALDLANLEAGWQTLPQWPGDPRSVAVGVAQAGRFFLLSGRGESGGAWQFYRDAYSYDPHRREWTVEAPLPWCVTAGLAVPAGRHDLIVVGGDKDLGRWNLIEEQTALAAQHPVGSPQWQQHNDVITWIYDHHTGDNLEVLRYDTRARRWSPAGWFPGPVPVTTPGVLWNGDLVVVSGEVRPGIRTPAVWRTPV